MNRQDFYLNLALELNNLKVPPELINTHIDQFKQYLQTLSEADAEKQIASFGDVKALAANIYRLLCGGDDAPEPVSKAPVKNEPEEESVYDAFRVEEEDEDIVTLLEDTSVVNDQTTDINNINDRPVRTRAKKEFIPKPSPTAEPATDATVQFTLSDVPLASEAPVSSPEAEPIEDTTDGTQLAMDFGSSETINYVTPDPDVFDDVKLSSDTVVIDSPVQNVTPEAQPVPPTETENEEFTEFTFDDLPKRKERSVGGLVLFYSLFILTLPLTLTLFIVSMALFGALYLVFGILTGAFFVLIFATAVAGALLALSGGLYGVGQMKAGGGAIGMFELGLALIIVGVTVFACFLFSMISLKWLPALLKCITKLLKLYLNSLIRLFTNTKGRFAKI